MRDRRTNYYNLRLEYLNPKSLSYKKLRIVDHYIDGGTSILDIGIGTGELISLEKEKFERIYGIDIDKESVQYCRNMFKNYNNIKIILSSANNIFDNELKLDKFDYITCLDVLEHIDINVCKKLLKDIFDHLKDNGKFIFCGPGIFEKLRIFFGRSPAHLHSHSSFGWRNMLESTGFKITNIETIEFPILDNNLLRRKIHIFGKCCLIIGKKI